MNVLDVKFPRVVTIMRDGHPLVVGDHVVVDGKDRLAVGPEPRNLMSLEIVNNTCELGFSPSGHCNVVNWIDELWRAAIN